MTVYILKNKTWNIEYNPTDVMTYIGFFTNVKFINKRGNSVKENKGLDIHCWSESAYIHSYVYNKRG